MVTVIIDSNEVVAESLVKQLREKHLNAEFLPVTDQKQTTKDAADLARRAEDHVVFVIDTDLHWREGGRTGNNSGAILARNILAVEDIRSKVSIILTSPVRKSHLEQNLGVKLDQDVGLAVLEMPYQFSELIESIEKCTAGWESRKGMTAAAKRFNLAQAIECLRTTKHAIKNSVLAVVAILRNQMARPDDDEMFQRLVGIVRRDEGNDLTWVDWFRQELSSLESELARLGFMLDQEVPNEWDRLKKAQGTIESYLTNFHLGEPENNITSKDKESIQQAAKTAYDAFRSLNDIFDAIKDQLSRGYGS